MRRREFLGVLGGAAAWPLVARAQQPLKRPLIGVLSPLSAAAATRNIVAFRSALRDLGYVDGRNVTYAFRYGEGSVERLTVLARELVALKPDILFAGSTPGVLAARDATLIDPDCHHHGRRPGRIRVCKQHLKTHRKHHRNLESRGLRARW